MALNRKKLRDSAFNAASARQFRKLLVPLRDITRPARAEPVLDIDGKPVMEPVLDAEGKPVLDAEGRPTERAKEAPRCPAQLDDEGQPILFEVRQPSVAMRSAILARARVGKAQKSGDPDQVASDELIVECALQLVYLPGSEERVFEEADRSVLKALPVGSFLDNLAEVALPLLNVEGGTVGKNSARTPGGSSSSP